MYLTTKYIQSQNHCHPIGANVSDYAEYRTETKYLGVIMNIIEHSSPNYLKMTYPMAALCILITLCQDVYSPDGNGSYYDFWKKYEGVPEDEDFEPYVGMSPGL